MDNEKYERINKRLVELNRKPKAEIQAIVKQYHKVIDTNEPKPILVWCVLAGEFGHKTMEKFAEFEGE